MFKKMKVYNFSYKPFPVIILIISISNFVLSWHHHDYDYFNHGYDTPSTSYYYSKQLYEQPNECRCIKLKHCSTIREIVKNSVLPLSEDLKMRIRKTGCGYTNGEPLICCPATASIYDLRSRRSHHFDRHNRHRDHHHNDEVTEKPWVWDVEPDNSGDKTHIHNENCDFNDNYHNKYYHHHNNYNTHNNYNSYNPFGGVNFVPNFSNGFTTGIQDVNVGFIPNNFPNLIPNFNSLKYPANFKFREFHPHFEDRRTKKNCPPSFSPEFDVENTLTVVTPDPPSTQPVAQNPAMASVIIAPVVDGGSTPAAQETPTVTPATPAPAPPIDEAVVQARTAKRTLINAPLCGTSVNTRIIGGEDAGPGQFPWMARLAYRNTTSSRLSYRCAGSVISERYVLTAAHCVSNLIDDLEVVMVRLGELDIRTDRDCDTTQTRCTEAQDYMIERIIAHSMYDTPKYANDIALIRLAKSTTESPIISPLCLPIDSYAVSDDNFTGQMGIISGWGSMTSGSNAPSSLLQWVRLPIVDTIACAQSYARFSANSRTPIIVSSAQLCVQGRENMDACQGDSGGPLMSDAANTNERYTLLGLVSFGPRTCGVSNFPGVYTKVTSYIDWIVDNMEM